MSKNMIMKLLYITCSGSICWQMWLSPPGAGICSAHELLGVYPPKALRADSVLPTLISQEKAAIK